MEAAVLKFLSHPLVIVGILSAIGTGLYRFALWKGAVDEGRTNIADFMKEVRADIKKILSIVGTKDPAMGSASPLRLTEFGESLSKAINGKQWAERLSQSGELRNLLEGKSDYEIQEACIEHTLMEMSTTDQEKRVLQKCAYDHGVEELVVRRVLGIELRDKLIPIIRQNPK